jgi:acylpyruvate hydrolase
MLILFFFKVNDEMKQKGSTKDMIFDIPFLISHISSIFTLMEGDVILTGMLHLIALLQFYYH